MTDPQDDSLELLTPKQVARLFNVDPKTVARWVNSGKIPSESFIKTPGGHVRIKSDYVKKILKDRT